MDSMENAAAQKAGTQDVDSNTPDSIHNIYDLHSTDEHAHANYTTTSRGEQTAQPTSASEQRARAERALASTRASWKIGDVLVDPTFVYGEIPGTGTPKPLILTEMIRN
jgi:hypothetical protein